MKKTLKIVLVSRNKTLYSSARLIEAATSQGHEIIVVDPLSCYMIIKDSELSVYETSGKKLDNVNAVIPRIGTSVTFYGTALLRQFETKGVYCLNNSSAVELSRNKFSTHQYLFKEGIPMPATGFANSAAHTTEIIKALGGAPLIIKLLESTQGQGVVLAETNKMAERLIETFRDLKASFLVQEFIKEAKGEDIRCFVLGQKVVAAMLRKAKPGEFRANIHRGGTAEPIILTAKEEELAIHAAKTLGLELAGVDILRSGRGPLVLEVNSSPGLEGIETATGINIAGSIINYLEKIC